MQQLIPAALLLNVFWIAVTGLNPKMQLVLTSINQCKGREDLPIVINRWDVIQQEKSNFYLSGTANISQEFRKGFEVHIRIDKCPADARLGNCDVFMNNFAVKNICYYFKITQPPLNGFLNAMKPKLKCPLKAGEYTLTTLRVEESLSEYLPQIGATFWNIIIIGKEEGNDVACVEISASVRPRRMRG